MADIREEEGEEVDSPSPWISNAGHPLVNPVVASKIFEMVKLPELRTLRLVCKDWHSTSLSIWRRTVQISVHAHSSSSNEQNLLWKSLRSELDVAGEPPFRNFRLHFPQFIAPSSTPYCNGSEGEEYRNMEWFWGDYGHWIHKLELKEAYVADVDAFKRAIFEQTPNLQELIWDGLTDERVWRGTDSSDPLPAEANLDENEAAVKVQPNVNLRVFSLKYRTELPCGWRLLFNRFPNIEKLELAEPRKSVDEFVGCLEEMLRNPARHPNLPITDLRLRNFAVKRMLGMSLVKLKVLHSDGNLGIFETAMQLHGSTLEELHLQNGYSSMDFWEAQMDPFPNLTEFEMKAAIYAFSLDFLNKLPNLKVLRLEQEQANEELMRNGTNWPALERMPHLREFYFIVSHSAYVLSEEILERLAEVMPNLESFTGQLNNLALQVVCRNWRQLKELAILSGKIFHGMDIDDVGITGIVPMSACLVLRICKNCATLLWSMSQQLGMRPFLMDF